MEITLDACFDSSYINETISKKIDRSFHANVSSMVQAVQQLWQLDTVVEHFTW